MKKSLLFLPLGLLFFGCKKDLKESDKPAVQNLNIVTTPIAFDSSDIAPLTTQLTFSTSEAVYMEVSVLGKHGTDTDISYRFDTQDRDHELTVLGLYPDYLNTVALAMINSEGNIIDLDTVQVQTKSELPENLPEITIKTAQKTAMADGLTLISNYGKGMHVPFMIDHHGDIRWYLDYSGHPELNNLFYDCGIERLQNGNMYFGNNNSSHIYEVDMRGEIVNSWPLSGYFFHHNVQDKPNGNLLVTASKSGSLHDNGNGTIEDYVVELDRNGGGIIQEWDLKESLDEYRTVMRDELNESTIDWFHGNAVIYDARDNTIIVSGRTQGLVKLDYNNNVKWILGPHKAWGTDRAGNDLNQYLLTPLDASGNRITDVEVLDGNIPHADFEWNWFQHAPELMPNGHIILFDNGDRREWDNGGKYSRAVEFNIDEEAMTVQQIWSYGQNRGTETFSFIVSDVDYLPKENHVLFAPGCIRDNTSQGRNEGRVIEVDYDTQQVLFEAQFITPPGGFVALHRAERMTIYAD
ncbi:MAG TPA: hypothetical protein DIU20_02110 [Cryomorphaceae bacterium]|nr:hypothetical protein [Cryomorphaceae bacterium]